MTTKKSKGWRPKSAHVIAVAIAAGSFLWVASGMVAKEPLAESQIASLPVKEAPAPLVRVQKSVAQIRVREVTLFGRTEAINTANIAAETTGRIVKRSAEKGDQVKKGSIILNIDIDNRRVKLDEAEADVDYQEIAYNAAKKLSNKQFQSRVKLAEFLARLEKAKANLKMIKLEINRTVIRTPISGFIDELPMNVGDYVRSGDVVATVVDLNPIRIVGQVSERDISRIHQGDVAQARLPNGQEIAGTIRYVSRTGSKTTRTFRVDVWVDNADGAIPQGLTTEISLPAGQELAHQLSPALLTLSEEGAIGIKSVDDNGIVQFYPVKVVSDTTDGIWLSGLPNQVTLITVGQEFVRVGQKVRTSDGTQKEAPDGSGMAKADPS